MLQRRCALRIIFVYRKVFFEAGLAVTDITPWDLLAEERARVQREGPRRDECVWRRESTRMLQT